MVEEGKIPINPEESLMTYLKTRSCVCSSYNVMMEGLGGVEYAKEESQ